MPRILASPDYRSGHLLVVITADTSSSAANGNTLATVLVNPDVVAGTQDATLYDALLAAAPGRGAARTAAARKRGDGNRHGGGLQPAAAGANRTASAALAVNSRLRVTPGRPRGAYDADIDGQARHRRRGEEHGAA